MVIQSGDLDQKLGDSVTEPGAFDAGRGVGALGVVLLQSPKLRNELMSEMNSAAKSEYLHYRELFLESLSEPDRQLYKRALTIPYAEKDWWRDAHDVFVTWSISVIVREENRVRSENNRYDLLPDWLITAAIVHDRGYGMLAAQETEQGRGYAERRGAFWEQGDTRIQHALLSRNFAEALLTDESEGGILKGVPVDQRDLFLSVIERHDYPFIGRYEELPEVTRHHFDADSLYSISLSSFVKDYLSYLEDPARRDVLSRSGLCRSEGFLPETLLAIRMARFFSTESELPEGWNKTEFPLRVEAASYGAEQRTIRPLSASAREMTDNSFLRLAQCCRVMKQVSTVADFLPWYINEFRAQFRELSQRALPGQI